MILQSITVINLGKIEHFSYNFTDGLTVLHTRYADEIAYALRVIMNYKNIPPLPQNAARADIGEAVGMSNNTVKKYVESLEKKGFISTEPTLIKTRDGRTHNGSPLYTLQPLAPIEEAYFEKKMRESQAQSNFRNALKKYEKKGAKVK